MTVTIQDIHEATKRIKPYIHRTPVLTNESLNQKVGANVFMKCENLQKIGAFKFRGASNAVWSLTDEEAKRGVCTHSSGNHAQALALAAKMRGIPAYIVMPSNAPQVKKDAVAGYGGQITYCEPTLEARESNLEKVKNETGATMIHPYNNEKVIAGQGTATLELLEEIPNLDVIIAPIGGGGLISGTSIAATETKRGMRVIGAEPEMADDAFRSMKAGKIMPSMNPNSIADGLLSSLGSLTFPIIQERVEQIVTVSESAMIESMKFIWERAKIIIEPSSATVIAVLWEKKIDLAGLNVGVILSGGNVDLGKLYW
ncbi:MAG: pyridoxal-5'-phosphate-dependent enzyme subunit beta [Chloroflexi bacterium OLB14]|nr:MAG: pyridoxal-5'-phosphate-dependent enzyme subunit beta [Chloroflexi bacterium OLB14]